MEEAAGNEWAKRPCGACRLLLGERRGGWDSGSVRTFSLFPSEIGGSYQQSVKVRVTRAEWVVRRKEKVWNILWRSEHVSGLAAWHGLPEGATLN